MKLSLPSRSLPSVDRLITWAVPLLLAGVLIALALLQYRWSREVSEAATTRMQTSLQESMMNFRLDLARELATMSLQLQGENAASVEARGLSQRIGEWQRTSPLSGLILNVFVWRRADQDGLPLRLLLQPERFEKMTAWPGEFEAAREVLLSPNFSDEKRSNLSPALRPKRTGESQPATKGAILGAIDQSVPLLIVPATRSGESIWLIIQLDRVVLRDRLFPQLTERYFGDGRSSEYEAAVLSTGTLSTGNDQTQIIFASSPGFNQGEQRRMDATLNLFGVPAVRMGQPQSAAGSLDRGNGFSPAGGPGLPMGQPGMGFFKIRFDPIHSGQNDRDWQIVAKHRTGSVTAAVARLRRRNLEISFGVLLVLAASVTLIVFNSQRARRLATLQMEFVAGVSHELRTPVAAILSISENIVDGVVANEAQLLRYGGMIRNQARLLQHLVEQVLRFAALQRPNTSYTIRPIRIGDLINEVVENMATMIAASGFAVERDIAPDLPEVNADFGVLSQCVQNLMTNAIKYGGEQKWIGLRAALSRRSVPALINLTVEDHGIGIDADELKHIFEPFYRSPKVIESPVHGTGLGLSLAKNFAEAMGGWLTVTSEPGRGSAFTIHIPVASHRDTQSQSLELESAAAQAGHLNQTVLNSAASSEATSEATSEMREP
jgi:two-component system, OmpR family, sensor histidine kinase SenX3